MGLCHSSAPQSAAVGIPSPISAWEGGGLQGGLLGFHPEPGWFGDRWGAFGCLRRAQLEAGPWLWVHAGPPPVFPFRMDFLFSAVGPGAEPPGVGAPGGERVCRGAGVLPGAGGAALGAHRPSASWGLRLLVSGVLRLQHAGSIRSGVLPRRAGRWRDLPLSACRPGVAGTEAGCWSSASSLEQSGSERMQTATTSELQDSRICLALTGG